MKDIYWGNSQCVGSWLHKFVTYKEHLQGIEEICVRCKERIFLKVINGRIDNLNYIDYHKRDILFPQHPYFKHEYGK